MSWSNADESNRLAKRSNSSYGKDRVDDIALAQVYALLAIADAISEGRS